MHITPGRCDKLSNSGVCHISDVLAFSNVQAVPAFIAASMSRTEARRHLLPASSLAVIGGQPHGNKAVRVDDGQIRIQLLKELHGGAK